MSRVEKLATGPTLLVICACRVSSRAAEGTDSANRKRALHRYIQTLVASPEARYALALVDVNTDRVREAILYVNSSDQCGIEDCPMLILKSQADRWAIVSKTTITQLPIHVLERTSNGWWNIGVRVQSGGIQPGYEAELQFNGTSYPRNPSVPPARCLRAKVKGEFAIPSSPVWRQLNT